MTDEQTHKPGRSTRISVFISAEARSMLAEMGPALFPASARTDGLVIDAAIREKYAAFKHGKREEPQS